MGKTKIQWAEHALANGHRVRSTNGYVLVRCPEHPKAKPNGYVYEHRLAMECHLGRLLCTHECVHHVNGSPDDNRVENLSLTSSSEHAKTHMSSTSLEVLQRRAKHLIAHAHARRVPRTETECACGCKTTIVTPDRKGRLRRFVQGHGQRGKHWTWRKH